MTTTEKKKLVKCNTLLWLAAMVLPAFFHMALATTKFPWPVLVPLLLLGPMIASNKMIAQAIGQGTDADNAK